MTRNSMLTIGFLAALAATGAMGASDSLAQIQRVDVIDHLPKTAVQEEREKAAQYSQRVDVIEDTRSSGRVTPYTASISH